MKRLASFITRLIVITVLSGCASTKLDSYVSPGFSSGSILKVAVMPITNQRINAGQAIELNRAFMQEIRRRNPNVIVVGGQQAIAALNEKTLADLWHNFLVVYSTSALPNTKTLSQVASALGVDVVIIGAIIHVKQEDSDGWSYPITQVTMRYTMFDGKDGTVLWEVIGEGKHQPYGWSAPPIFEIAKLAHEKILANLPF